MHIRPPQPRWSLLTLAVLLGALPLGSRAGGSEAAQTADSPDAGRPAPLILEDPPQPLTPQRPRSEADQDRLDALVLFAAARTHERRQHYEQALRLYQRALRSDPQALTVARAVVGVALRLDREAQAIRYILKAAEIEEPDPARLEQLGAHLLDVGDLRGAARFYEGALAARDASHPSADDVRVRMALGRLYYALGEHGKAAEHFARAIHALDHPQESGLDSDARRRLLSDPGRIYNLFGECFLLADRLDAAEAAFRKAHEIAPNQGLLDYHLARIYARRGSPQRALDSLEACFRQHLASEETAPYRLLAEVLDKLGKKEELIERLERLHTEDPKNVWLGSFLAEQYHSAGQFAKAEPLYVALVEETPVPTGYRRLVEIYHKTHRPDALLDLLAGAVKRPGLLEMLGAELQAVAADGEMTRSVVDAARKRYESRPEQLDYESRLAVALLALQGRQLEIAGEFFDLAAQADPDQTAEVFLAWGVGLLLGGHPAEAVAVFQRAIGNPALAEYVPRFHYLLAEALVRDGQTDEAVAAARKAVEEEPDVPLFRGRVAWILYRARRHDQAIEAYRALIEKYDPDHASSDTREVLREARLVLSSLYVLKDDLVEAEEWLQQVLDEFPDDVGASNDLGYLWADQGKHLNRALKMIQYAVEASPDNAAYRDSLGWVFYRLERHTEAVAELKKAAALEDPPDPVILDHLGDAHLKANQPEEAKHAWRQAAEAFTKREEPEKAEQVQQKIRENESPPEKAP